MRGWNQGTREVEDYESAFVEFLEDYKNEVIASKWRSAFDDAKSWKDKEKQRQMKKNTATGTIITVVVAVAVAAL